MPRWQQLQFGGGGGGGGGGDGEGIPVLKLKRFTGAASCDEGYAPDVSQRQIFSHAVAVQEARTQSQIQKRPMPVEMMMMMMGWRQPTRKPMLVLPDRQLLPAMPRLQTRLQKLWRIQDPLVAKQLRSLRYAFSMP